MPITTRLVFIVNVTGNEEPRVFRSLADQQLVGVSVVCSHAVPQSISTSTIPIVISGLHGPVHMSLEVGLVSSLIINEDYFSELEKQKQVILGNGQFNHYNFYSE